MAEATRTKDAASAPAGAIVYGSMDKSVWFMAALLGLAAYLLTRKNRKPRRKRK